MQKHKPVVLLILDGWGLSPSWGGNALAMNNPKNIDQLWRNYPHKILQALGAIEYGNVVGESRLGHLMIGTGRSVKSTHRKITEQIENRKFYKNDTLLGAINWCKKNKSNLHLMGMISNGGVHSDIDHLLALMDLAYKQGFSDIYIDAITDGVDTGPTDALLFIEKINDKASKYKFPGFSSIGGRKFAMDRDEHWDRIRIYYETLTSNKGKVYASAEEAVSANYRNNLNDNQIEPGLIKDQKGKINPIKGGDAVVFFNFREDRARQLSKVFLDPKFRFFLWKPVKVKDLYFATFTDYDKNLPAKVVFKEEPYKKSLSEVLATYSLKQLKIAESEKYAHVTYFLNGGQEEPFVGEERKIISSPNVESYDLKPEMSAKDIAKAALDAIRQNNFDFIAINFANVDMIAHTGNIIAVGQAVKLIDDLVGKIANETIARGGALFNTADHGNAEQMINIKQNSEKETLHTLNPVPLMLITPENRKDLIKSSVGYDANTLSKIITAKENLADVAPTILEILNIPKPAEMTGHSLLNKLE